MIKKLNQRVFMIIMISLSIVVIGIIIIFAILNYNNAINTTNFMMDRFIGEEPKDKIEDYKPKAEIDVEGVYNITIKDNIIVQSLPNINDNKINEYALKLASKNTTKGIIGKYIYRTRRINHNIVRITFIENENVILYVKLIYIISIVMSVFSIIIIYIVAKKLSATIVKPVEETLEKQKQFISDASHELKTPLAVIEANADVLENKVGTNKWISYIQNEIDSMNTLINELLLLAKMENIDNLKEYEQYDLSKQIEIVLSMFESMAYENKIKLKSNIEANITMNGIKDDIEHIVSILLDNAIKHTDEKNK